MRASTTEPLQPTSGILCSTAEVAFASCEGSHEALLTIFAGISARDALASAERHLHSARDIAECISRKVLSTQASLHHATVWAVDACRAILCALIGHDDTSFGPTQTREGARRQSIGMTVSTAIGSNNAEMGASPIFSVRAGVMPEDALVHASLYLRAAYATADEVCGKTSAAEQGLHWAMLGCVEAALALVEALLGGAKANGDASIVAA